MIRSLHYNVSQSKHEMADDTLTMWQIIANISFYHFDAETK